MANFSLSNFQAEVAARGMAKLNRFEVQIVPPPAVAGFSDGKLVSLMCDAAVLPPTRIQTSAQRIFGPASFHPQFADYGGENLTLQFLMDGPMMVKRFFDRWVDSIVNRAGGTVSYQSNYLCNKMTISQLNEQDQATYAVEFVDAFPVAVNPVNLDFNQSNQVGRLSVTFNYRRWFEKAVSAPQRETPPAGQNRLNRDLRLNASVSPPTEDFNWASGQYGDNNSPRSPYPPSE